jgi:hypothetical protein
MNKEEIPTVKKFNYKLAILHCKKGPWWVLAKRATVENVLS